MLSLGYRNDPVYSTDDSIFNFRLFDTTQAANAPTSAATTQLRIGGPGPIVLQASGGNVGIGTVSPNAAKLDVNQTTAGVRGLRVLMPTAAENTAAGIQVFGYSPAIELIDKDSVQNWYIGIDDNDANKFLIGRGYGPGQGVTQAITVNTSDQVGIGTTNPGYPLDVNGDVRVGLPSIGHASGSPDVFVQGNLEIDATAYMDGPLVTGASGIATSGSITQSGSSFVTFAGKVGIGTTLPVTQLAVKGLTGTTSYNYVRVNTATGDFYYDSSSRRYKEDIQPLQEDSPKILQLQAKSFRDKSSGQREIGYIAEELDGMGLQNLVIYDNKGRPDGIKYEKVALYLVEVVKQQQKQIDALKATIKN